MPNTAVKPANAESTWGEAPWEDRKPLISEKALAFASAFLLFVVSGSWLVFAALWPYRRGRSLTSQTAFGGQLPYKGSLGRPAVIFDHSLFRMMVSFYEPRTTSHGFFLGFRCGVPPRQTQADNDASGNPQRVAGRLDRTSPTISHTGDEMNVGCHNSAIRKKTRPSALCVGADPARAARRE